VKRAGVWLLGIAAAVALVAGAAAIVLPYLVRTPRIQSLIAAQASQALGRPVTFSSMSVSLLPLPAVVLSGLRVAEDARFGTAPFLTLERGELRLRLRALVGGRIEFGDLILKKPVIAIAQDPQGRWNFATLGPGGAEPRAPSSRPRGGGSLPRPAPVASDVRLVDGVVTVTARPAGRPPQTYRIDDLDAALHGGAGAATFTGSAKLQPGDVTVRIDDGRVTQGGKPLGEAGLAGKVTIEGKQVKDLAALVLGRREPVVAAAVKGALALAGTVASPRATGEMALADVAVTHTVSRCPDPKQRTLKLRAVKLGVAWQDGQFSAAPVTTGVASGAISTNVVTTVERAAQVQVRDLVVRALPLEKVLVDFLCQGYAVTGPLDLTGAFTFEARDAWNTLGGAGRLTIGAGKVVGAQALTLLDGVVRLGAMSSLLAADMPAALFSSPLEFDSIVGTYHIAKGVVTTRDLLYTSRAMRVAVVGDYALGSGRVNLEVVINHGRGEMQAKVTGTATSPSIRVVPASPLRGVDPERARSGLDELLRRLR
jgi:uncharacterized protein YhdP